MLKQLWYDPGKELYNDHHRELYDDLVGICMMTLVVVVWWPWHVLGTPHKDFNAELVSKYGMTLVRSCIMIIIGSCMMTLVVVVWWPWHDIGWERLVVRLSVTLLWEFSCLCVLTSQQWEFGSTLQVQDLIEKQHCWICYPVEIYWNK